MSNEHDIRMLLAEALDLYARARTLEEAADEHAAWQRQAGVPEASASVLMWAEEMHERDKADWERRAAAALASPVGKPKQDRLVERIAQHIEDGFLHNPGADL